MKHNSLLAAWLAYAVIGLLAGAWLSSLAHPWWGAFLAVLPYAAIPTRGRDRPDEARDERDRVLRLLHETRGGLLAHRIDEKEILADQILADLIRAVEGSPS